MHTIRKAFGYLIRLDFDKIWRAITDRIPSWMFRRSLAYIYELQIESTEADNESRLNLPEGYVFRKIDLDGLSACSAMVGLPAEEYLRRHRAGDLSYGVFFQHQPVNVNWLHFGPCYVRGLGYQFNTESSDCYIYGIVTSPDHRNRGIYKSTQPELIRIARSQGAQRVIQVAMEANIAVKATLPKCGYEIVGTVHHRSVFGIRWTIVRDCEGRVPVWQWRIGNPHDGIFQI
jgi:GNAT superfamily N-acetyltransferase